MSPLGARLQKLLAQCAYVFVALLPFLVPFDANRNVDMQGLILLIAGGFAWCVVALTFRQVSQQLTLTAKVMIGVYIACCLVNLVVNHDGPYAFVGAPYIRLGSLGLISCIGCGLVLQHLKARDLISYLYGLISLVALLSIPYTLVEFGSLARISGLVAQADVLGVLLGCGLLLGLMMLKNYPKWRNYLFANQLLLGSLLFLTGTRAAILLTLGLMACWQVQANRTRFFRQLPICVVLIILVIGGLHYSRPNRLSSVSYAGSSISYRFDLQADALRRSLDKPLFGYGASNLSDVLDCSKLTKKSLQATCDDGYFFNSSHDIFIDRMLGLGWLGGLAYLSIIVLAIYQGLRSKVEARIFGYLTLLISLYYLTNVTSVVLELLIWITLLQCLKLPVVTKRKPLASRV